MIDFFSSNLWLLWALACLVLLILELGSGDFFIMCFSIGTLAAAVVSPIIPSLLAQVIIWVAVSVLCIFFVRPVMLKYFHRHGHDRKSNADALIGRTGKVIEDIAPGSHGYVAVDGDQWRAVTRGTSVIPVGTLVRIVARDSIIVTVEVLSN